MDLSALDTTLTTLRERGDCTLASTTAIGPGFVSNPPHRVGIAHLMLKPRFLLADPPGTGKTPQALIAYGLLREKSSIPLRLLVVTPKSALFQWKDAVDKFLTGVTAEVMGYDEEERHGGRDARHAHWRLSEADILITTYASMARDIEIILPSLDYFLTAFDEVQALRSSEQRVLRPAGLMISQKARGVWGLSATPIHNDLGDLFGVMEVIRPGIFGRSLKRFYEMYFNRVWVKLGRTGKGFWHVKGYKNLPHLMEVIRPFYLKRPASVIAQYLPPVVTQQRRLRMTEPQRAIYQQIVRQHFPAGGIPAAGKIHKLASLAYAQQASDAPSVMGFTAVGPPSKLTDLIEFLSEEARGEKVIVYTRYERVVTFLEDQLKVAGVETVRITGKESAGERRQAQRRFNLGGESGKDSEGDLLSYSLGAKRQKAPPIEDYSFGKPGGESPVDVILITAAGGAALDLQAARIVVLYDLPWSWGELTQIVGRARRVGSPHESIMAVLLINEGSIDEHTLSILEDKESLVGATFGLDDGSLVAAPPERVTDQLYSRLQADGAGASVGRESEPVRGDTAGSGSEIRSAEVRRTPRKRRPADLDKPSFS